MCRKTPRVKHHHKDAIIEVVEITRLDYDIGIAENLEDPYLTVDNIQNQGRITDFIIDRIQTEDDVECALLVERQTNEDSYFLGKKPVNNPKNFVQRYQHEGFFLEEIQNNTPTAFQNYCNLITGSGKCIKKVNVNSITDIPLSESLFSLIKDKSCKSPDVFVKRMKSFLRRYYKTCETEDSIELFVVMAYYIFILEKINSRPDNDIEGIINIILKMVYKFEDKLELDYFENCLFDYRAYDLNSENCLFDYKDYGLNSEDCLFNYKD